MTLNKMYCWYWIAEQCETIALIPQDRGILEKLIIALILKFPTISGYITYVVV
jgi:hypothetical protein